MFVGLSTLDDLDAPPCPLQTAAYKPHLLTGLRPGGWVIMATVGARSSHLCSDVPTLQYSPEALAAKPGESFKMNRTGETHATPFGSTQEFWNTRLVLGEGREASSCRVNYRTDAGAPFWIRSVKGAVRSIGRGADILRIGIRSAGFYALDARRTCRTMVKALGCDRDACTNGYQIRQCQPRASGLRRT
jgi:hypothetical protein